MTKGERIKSIRENLNISQTDLAKKIGISKQNLYKYENNLITNIPSDIIEKLASALFCTPGYIMGWDDISIRNASADSETVPTAASSSSLLTPTEVEIILAFRRADTVTQDNICKLLDVKRDSLLSKEAN